MGTVPSTQDTQLAEEAQSFRVSATLPSEETEVGNFLATAFPDGAQAESFRSDVLAWKYFSPHPDWSTSRSYVLKAGEQIVAHGGIWPVHLLNSSAEVRAAHLIDWAASPIYAGGGALLLRKMAADADPLLTIGGSPDCQSILPRLGYQRVGELRMYARVVRPWLQFRSTPGRNWKSPLRMARNVVWSLSGVRSPEKNWSASQITRFDSSSEALLNAAPTHNFVSQRTTAGLNRFLICPAATFSAFEIFKSERRCGYFVLSQVGHQTRVVELRVASEDPESWLQACALASRTAAELPETSEIVAGFSSSRVQRALEETGFRLRAEDPIYCYDPRRLLGSTPKLEVSLLDSDACFMTDPRHPYLS